jgi:predicted porin
MNKKLIVIGIAAALAAPLAAQAGVEVYGKARMSVDYSDNGDDNPGQEKSNMSVSSNASRIGFKGDEDLGGGLTALWQYEEGVSFDTGTWGTDNRPSFLGVAGGFGTVLAGRLDTPYKSTTNSWDPFVDTKADYNSIMVGPRVSNTLAYMSPDMNGFNVDVAYVMPSVTTGADGLPITTVGKKQSAYDLDLIYNQGPLAVIAGYLVENKGGDTSATAAPGSDPDNATAWKVGAKYVIMDATTLGLIYENQDVGGDIKDHNNIYFLATHKIGDTTLKLAYTKADKCGGTSANCDQTGADQISVGVSQALTKNTEVYALYSQISNEDHALYGLSGGPAAVLKASGTQTSDPSTISIGMNVNFSSK